MENTQPEANRLRTFKIKLAVIAITLFLGLMILSNPTEKSFVKYMREYVKAESRSTLTPESPAVDVGFVRSNYFFFSSYQVEIDGNMHEYLGIFGTFKKY